MLQCKTVFENLFYHSSSPDWNHFWQPLQKTSSFLATGEPIKGRKHMFTVRQSPWRKHWQPFNLLSQWKCPNVSLEQNPSIVLSIFSFNALYFSRYVKSQRNSILMWRFHNRFNSHANGHINNYYWGIYFYEPFSSLLFFFLFFNCLTTV